MSTDGNRGKRQTVLVAGAGIAGIEAALALHDLAGERLDVSLCDPRQEFVFRPFAVGQPYGSARAFRYDLRSLAQRCGSSLRQEGIGSVDPSRRFATTRGGERLSYDSLIVAPGARMLSGVPGALTFWGAADEVEIGELMAELRAGALARIVFTMPPGPSWTLPLYELALLALKERDRSGSARTRVTVVTPEDVPLEVFGHAAAKRMSGLLAKRGIEVVAGTLPIEFDGGKLRTATSGDIDADAVIALPRLEGRRITGVPHDDSGFIAINEHGRVNGTEWIYAAGDVTRFPVKQGGIATQQADAVAEAIAAAAGASRKVTARYLTPFFETLAAEAEASSIPTAQPVDRAA